MERTFGQGKLNLCKSEDSFGNDRKKQSGDGRHFMYYDYRENLKTRT